MIRIIHITSFKGNIGDRINHNGFYKLIQDLYGEVKIEQVEMRDFYFSAKNRKRFDCEFAEYINRFDMCVLGGGSFFDAQWENSNTGVSMDLSSEFIDRIKVPVLVNAMGYHEYPDVTNSEICSKFQKFLKLISSRDNWLITVRNDGSYERLISRYGTEIINKTHKVPDNGFFCDFLTDKEIEKEKITIGMCITNDLFSEEYNKDVTTDIFNKIIANFIDEQSEKNRRIILFPHTPNDIDVISKIFFYLKSETKRNNIVVAPYNANTEESIGILGTYYNSCDCVIGMRFHSLVSAMRLRVPAIALTGHRQIEALFEDLSLLDYRVRVDNINFVNSLSDCLERILNNRENICKQYDDMYEDYLEKLYTQYKKKIQVFVSNNI